jgi:nicotinate-nucleotide--dimethylbenzimidazole phosphoribosyltransferase
MNKLENTLARIKGRDTKAVKKCEDWLDSRMKPKKSLGALEEMAIRIAGMTGSIFNSVERRCHLVAAADNGIVKEGVSSCPVEYTKLVSEAMLKKMAAIGILCDTVKADLKVVDIGIAGDIPRDYPNLLRKKVKQGTNNFAEEKAMSVTECIRAIEVGIDCITINAKDYDIFSNGEMGIGNTTTSSAILYAFTGKDIHEIVGRGGGLSDEGLKKKKHLILEASERYGTLEMDVIEVLAAVGGLDIACMVGFYLGAALCKKPILIDGFISSVAALAAYRLNPKARDYMLATHMSEEPGMKIAMDELRLTPFLDMNMRLGEGTGAVLTYPMIEAALEIVKRMRTVEEVYDILGR